MFKVVENCLNAGLEDETCDALEVFVMLVESPLPILEGDMLSTLVHFMLKVATSPLPRTIRQVRRTIFLSIETKIIMMYLERNCDHRVWRDDAAETHRSNEPRCANL
jgi:hypothetical protein